MGAALDAISPDYLRDQRFRIQVSQGMSAPRVQQGTELVFDYASAKPQGAMGPLVFEAKGTTPGSYQRRDFAIPPSTIVWIPTEPGLHQLTLREASHNRWFGVLKVTVAG